MLFIELYLNWNLEPEIDRPYSIQGDTIKCLYDYLKK